MDLGLGTLIEVKRHVLTPALVAATTYDARLSAIAKGVAGQMERFCNRKFARVAGDAFRSPADRSSLVLARYPIEEVTSLEIKFTEDQGWQQLDRSLLVQIANDKGLIQFYVRPGTYLAQLRVTYTGGFWYETKEPTDNGYPTAQPAGSTLLPDELKLAWLQQTARVWELMDKLGTGITKQGGEGAANLGQVEMTPEVKQVLLSYRRFN